MSECVQGLKYTDSVCNMSASENSGKIETINMTMLGI